MTVKTAVPASEKQVAFMEKLLAEKAVTDDQFAEFFTKLIKMPLSADEVAEMVPTFTKQQASKIIDFLLSKPKKKDPAAVELGDGMYMLPNGIIAKVQHAVHGSGNQYAKILKQVGESWEFEYAPGFIKKLSPEFKMSLEQAKEWGCLYGTCCVCGATLTDEHSIEAGIGPVCAKKF